MSAEASRLVVVPSTVSLPLPSPTLSLPVVSTFAAWAALPGSTMLTSWPLAANAVPAVASTTAMIATTIAGLGLPNLITAS